MLESDKIQRLMFGAGVVLLGLGLLFNPWLTNGVFERYGNASSSLTVPAVIFSQLVLLGLSARILYLAWRHPVENLKEIWRQERLPLSLAIGALVIILWILTHKQSDTFYHMFGAYQFRAC